MKAINQEKYYQRIKKLNIIHYAGEVPYYTKAPFREVERAVVKNLKPNSEVLDLGCGSGRFSIGVAQFGLNVIGVDITPEAVEAAKQKASSLRLGNIEFVVGDMTDLPFENNKFDYVFCPRFSINAVATFKKRKKAIEEMVRVVKNDGMVFIESFNKFYLGKGIFFLLKNIIRDFGRYIIIFFHWLVGREYRGLLPGDIIYKANKIEGAPDGYAHLPTIFELRKLIPPKTKTKFYSIPQLTKKRTIDLLKFFRYSIWIFLQKVD